MRMTAIRFSKSLALCLMWCGVAWVSTQPARAESARPNIVLLYADDMGYGDLGVQNPQSKIPTPNLDRLARQGMRFTDAHSSSGICSPSRYAMLTGIYHWRKFHGIVNSFGPSVFDDAELTLPEMLKQHGYRNACIGKWHLGWGWDAVKKAGAAPKNDQKKSVDRVFAPDAFDWSKPIPDGPLAHGFDYYFGDDVPNFPPYTWIENDRVLIEPTEPLVATPKTAEGNWEARPGPMAPGWKLDQVMPEITAKAVEWLRKQKGTDEPFFLYVPFTSPHAPIVPTEEFAGKSRAGGYGDFMVQTDWTVGQILDTLDELGVADNTLVIFSSDNGPERYAYDRVRNFEHRSMGPLRGLKRDLWEGGHRVPFIVRWPGHVRPGSISHALVSQIDLMATIAAIIGHELPDSAALDSHNLLPLWKSEVQWVRSSLVHNTNPNGYAVRQRNWVLIDAPKGGMISQVPDWYDAAQGYERNNQPGELYDLSQDLSQHQNVFVREPERVSELREVLKAIQSSPSAPRFRKEE